MLPNAPHCNQLFDFVRIAFKRSGRMCVFVFVLVECICISALNTKPEGIFQMMPLCPYYIIFYIDVSLLPDSLVFAPYLIRIMI